MNCTLCSQRIASDKGHDFMGDTLCGNCHARLRVGQHDREAMEDSFLPALLPEGEAREAMSSLSMRAGHVGRRGTRLSAGPMMLVLYEKYRGRAVEPGYATALTLAARTLALYGSDSGKGLTESEMRYLLSLSEQQASILETIWSSLPDGADRRFMSLRAFMGAIIRSDPSAEEVCARVLAYERMERGK